MQPQTLFYIIIGILIGNFLFDKVIGHLNARRFSLQIPDELNDVYDPVEYKKSQAYKKEKYRFGLVSGFVSIAATLFFFLFDGFAYVDAWARSFSENSIVIALLFFGIILLASSALSLPFSYYNTFVI
ncbi:MAG: M48 family peptidase, partial [Bacteroidota bacterium]